MKNGSTCLLEDEFFKRRLLLYLDGRILLDRSSVNLKFALKNVCSPEAIEGGMLCGLFFSYVSRPNLILFSPFVPFKRVVHRLHGFLPQKHSSTVPSKGNILSQQLLPAHLNA